MVLAVVLQTVEDGSNIIINTRININAKEVISITNEFSTLIKLTSNLPSNAQLLPLPPPSSLLENPFSSSSSSFGSMVIFDRFCVNYQILNEIYILVITKLTFNSFSSSSLISSIKSMLGGLFKGSEVTSGKVWKSFTEISSSLDRLLSLLSFDSFHDSSSKANNISNEFVNYFNSQNSTLKDDTDKIVNYLEQANSAIPLDNFSEIKKKESDSKRQSDSKSIGKSRISVNPIKKS